MRAYSRVFLGFLLVFMILSTVPVRAGYTEIPVTHYGYRDNVGAQTIAGRYVTQVNRPQERILQHSNGKICIVNFDSSTSHNFLLIYSETGTLEASIDLGYVSHGGMHIREYSDNEVLVIGGYCSVTHIYIYFDVVNIDSFEADEYYEDWAGLGGANSIDRIGDPMFYNDEWTVPVFWTSYYNANGGKISFITLADDLSTSTWGTATYVHGGNIEECFSFVDPDNLNMWYMVTSKASEDTYASLFEVNLDTEAWEVLASSGTNGVLPSGGTYARKYNNRLTYLGGGIYTDPVDGYIYVYQSWVYAVAPPTSTPTIHNYLLKTWVTKYNNTIDDATVLDNDIRSRSFADSSLSTDNEVGLLWGYVLDETLPTLSYRIIYNDFWLNSYVAESTVICSDLTTMASVFDSVESNGRVDGVYIAYSTYTANMAKLDGAEFSYHETSNSAGYLYLGEEPMVVSSTDTLSYTPNDATLVVGKTYAFHFTVYQNNMIWLEAPDFVIRFDGTIVKSGSFVNGEVYIPFTINMDGTHTVRIDVWNNTSHAQLYTGETHTLTWATSTNPTGGGTPESFLITSYINILGTWLPMLTVICVPAVGLALFSAKYAGGTGMVIGLSFGGLIGTIGGVVTGIINTYVLLLYILVLAVMLMLAMRTGGGGGGQ